MGAQIQLPDVGMMGYMVNAFLDMRVAVPGDYGPKSQTWAEVLAFSEATGNAREHWERQTLFDMSWDYVNEHQRASSPFTKSPMERPQ